MADKIDKKPQHPVTVLKVLFRHSFPRATNYGIRKNKHTQKTPTKWKAFFEFNRLHSREPHLKPQGATPIWRCPAPKLICPCGAISICNIPNYVEIDAIKKPTPDTGGLVS